MSCDATDSGPAVRSRFRFLLGLGLMTVGAGAFAVAFRASLAALYRSLFGAENVVDAIAGLPPWMRLVVPLVAAAIAGTIARALTPRSQGVSNVMEAIALGRVQLSLRSTASRVASSWVAIAGGLSIGREGPLIEVGGALGAAWSDITSFGSVSDAGGYALVGMAAATAASIHAP